MLNQTLNSVEPLEYFHIENPISTPWKEIAEAIREASPRPLKTVPTFVWLKELSKPHIDPQRVPAVRLLEFFGSLRDQEEGTSALSCESSICVAPELNVGPIGPEVIRKYVEYQMRFVPL